MGAIRSVGTIPNKAELEAALGEKIQENHFQSLDVIVKLFEGSH